MLDHEPAVCGRAFRPDSSSIFSPPWRLTTIGMVALVAMVAFEAMAVAAVMPTVVRELDGLALYALAFGITLATSVIGMTVAGSWSDARGPAAPLWTGLASFVAGLLLAGFAPDMATFLAGRLIQGLGGGAISVAIYVLMGRCYPQALRPRLSAAFATAWVVPSLAGPALSGVIAEHAGWRWVFLGVAGLALPAAAMLRPALRNLPGLGGDTAPTLQRIACAAGVATGICLLYLGGQQHGATAPSLLAVAAVLVAACAWKLLPVGTLRSARGLPSVVALRGLVCAAFYAVEAFVPLQLAQERGFSASMAGAVLSVGALGWTCGSWYQGHRRHGWSRHRFLRVGTSAVLVGVVATASITWPAMPIVVPVLGWIVAGLGMGLISPSLSVVVLSMSAPGRQGFNTSALALSEAIAVAAAMAVGGSLFAALLATSNAGAFLANYAIAAAMAVLAALVVGRTRTRQLFIS